MGWTDTHLHRFIIHGKDYGIAQIGGISFLDDPQKVQLADFDWRLKERFIYEYDFGDYWRHQIRVEKIFTEESSSAEPVCISGQRACPPEDCGGTQHFMALKQRYGIDFIAERLKEIIEAGEISDRIEEISKLRQWLQVNHFDLEQVNSRLKQYAQGGQELILFKQRIG